MKINIKSNLKFIPLALFGALLIIIIYYRNSFHPMISNLLPNLYILPFVFMGLSFLLSGILGLIGFEQDLKLKSHSFAVTGPLAFTAFLMFLPNFIPGFNAKVKDSDAASLYQNFARKFDTNYTLEKYSESKKKGKIEYIGWASLGFYDTSIGQWEEENGPLFGKAKTKKIQNFIPNELNLEIESKGFKGKLKVLDDVNLRDNYPQCKDPTNKDCNKDWQNVTLKGTTINTTLLKDTIVEAIGYKYISPGYVWVNIKYSQ